MYRRAKCPRDFSASVFPTARFQNILKCQSIEELKMHTHNVQGETERERERGKGMWRERRQREFILDRKEWDHVIVVMHTVT